MLGVHENPQFAVTRIYPTDPNKRPRVAIEMDGLQGAFFLDTGRARRLAHGLIREADRLKSEAAKS